MLKITISDEQEPSLQSADRCCKSEVEKICIYQKPGNWPSQHIHLKINSGFHARKNPSKATLSESSHVQWYFIQQKAHLCSRPYRLDNTLNRPSSALESFSIGQKQDLFAFVSHSLQSVGGSSALVLRFDTWNINQINQSNQMYFPNN